MPVYNSSYTGAQHDTYVTKEQLVNLIYPVGAIYISVNSTSPATLFGGTWSQIQDRFLLACGSSYSNGATGGGATHTHTLEHTHTTPATTTGSHTLTVNEMPSHSHGGATANANKGNSQYGPAYVHHSGPSNQGLAANDYHTSRFCVSYTDGFYHTHNITAQGGGAGHTHSQVATTTNSQSTKTTSSTSSLPPYLAVYVWKRTA